MTSHPRFFSRLLLIAGLFTSFSHAATTLSTTPTQDTTIATGVSNAFINNNYGGAGAFSVSGTGAGKGAADGVLSFNVASITSGFDTQYGAGNWTINSVVLGLVAQPPGSNNLFNSSNVAGTFHVDWVPNDSWVEGTGNPNAPTSTGLTWANASLGTAESLGDQSYNGNTGAMSFNLTPSAGLLGDIANGSTATLELSAVSSTLSGVFASRNNGTSSNWPVLSITASAVPEPGRMMLVMLGALGLCVRRRKAGSF
jgi:PEP-CTERM motif